MLLLHFTDKRLDHRREGNEPEIAQLEVISMPMIFPLHCGAVFIKAEEMINFNGLLHLLLVIRESDLIVINSKQSGFQRSLCARPCSNALHILIHLIISTFPLKLAILFLSYGEWVGNVSTNNLRKVIYRWAVGPHFVSGEICLPPKIYPH